MSNFKHIIIIIASLFLVISGPVSAGAKAKDAYFVKVDRETTTQNSKTKPSKKQFSSQSKKHQKAHSTGHRRYMPVKLNIRVGKSPPSSRKKSKIPGLHKSGDVTLKRGVVK